MTEDVCALPVNLSVANCAANVTGDVADLSLAGAQQQPGQQEGYMLDNLSATASFAGAAGGGDTRIAPLVPALQVDAIADCCVLPYCKCHFLICCITAVAASS